MKIIKLVVKNFRGISSLEWSTDQQPLCCLIGPGDSLKSTVLDAIEAVLSSRWFSFGEGDFNQCETTSDIKIEATVGELSKALLSDEKFGLYIRGLAPDGKIRDEPEDGDEPLLTVRLSVDATMEPLWEVVNDRAHYPRVMSNRDRALFRVVRLTGDDAKHLTWGQGSILAKLTESGDEAAQQLAAAYRAAKSSAQLDKIDSLVEVANAAQKRAIEVGAQVSDQYRPGLELGRGGFSSGSITLHDGQVPLRLAGTGTRRLATLAIQRAAIDEGAIVLVDEIEQGLEPHRILGAIIHLKKSQREAVDASRPTGQILMTTHSDVALGEIEPEALFVCRRKGVGQMNILHPNDLPALKRVLKHSPRALFAKRILVCEGDTELGLMLGMREHYPENHGGVTIEQRGSAIVDGQGTSAPLVAAAISALGYPTALFRDSDVAVPAAQQKELDWSSVVTITYASDISIDQAIFSAASEDYVVDKLLLIAEDFKGEATIVDQINKAFPEVGSAGVGDTSFSDWEFNPPISRQVAIERLGSLAKKNSWFKNRYISRSLAPLIGRAIQHDQFSELAIALKRIENGFYA
ncbi:hypothetical protein XcmpCFBP7700_02965 [Xanthomonas campestris]|nr:hypothetical protein XcmpCFBP7700_02965 [Xanthomonas campestris]